MHPSQGTAQGCKQLVTGANKDLINTLLEFAANILNWEHDLAAPSEAMLVQAHRCPDSPVHCGTTAHECPPLYGRYRLSGPGLDVSLG